VLAGLLVRRFIFDRLLRLASATPSGVGDVVITSLRDTVVVWGLLIGLGLGAQLVALPPPADRLLARWFPVVIILAASWTIARLAGALVTHAAVGSAGRLPSATLLVNVTRLLVLIVGALVVLQTLGISITPVLTALGVGGLAVGLALQDTLANLFAGIHLLTSRQVRPGDFVKLDTGQEGYIQDVTWRYTTIRQLPNNLIVVPNAKLASAVLTNYYLPDQELSVVVPVGVAFGSDLARVEQVAIDVGREVMREVPAGVPGFDPFIRYTAFGDSAITFNTILRAREVADQHIVRHEFIKRLHARFAREGIEIPFPIRTVYLRQPSPDSPESRPGSD